MSLTILRQDRMNTTTSARFDILHEAEEVDEGTTEKILLNAGNTVKIILDELIDSISVDDRDELADTELIQRALRDDYTETTEKVLTQMFRDGTIAIPGMRKADVEQRIADGENDVFAISTALDGMFGTDNDPYEILAARTEMHVNEHVSSVLETLRIELSGRAQPQLLEVLEQALRDVVTSTSHAVSSSEKLQEEQQLLRFGRLYDELSDELEQQALDISKSEKAEKAIQDYLRGLETEDLDAWAKIGESDERSCNANHCRGK